MGNKTLLRKQIAEKDLIFVVAFRSHCSTIRTKGINELRALLNKPATSALPEDLSPDQWSSRPSKEEERHPLENPNPLRSANAYTQAQILSELSACSDAGERVKFLTALRRAGAWFPLELVGKLLKDESPKVRVWAAANVTLHFRHYTDTDNPIKRGVFLSFGVTEGDCYSLHTFRQLERHLNISVGLAAIHVAAQNNLGRNRVSGLRFRRSG